MVVDVGVLEVALTSKRTGPVAPNPVDQVLKKFKSRDIFMEVELPSLAGPDTPACRSFLRQLFSCKNTENVKRLTCRSCGNEIVVDKYDEMGKFFETDKANN
ncbi:hypothetical protein ACOSQ2_016186 [Xanthoceras sorbifolium]